MLGGGIAVFVILIVGAFFLLRGDDDGAESADSTTSSTSPALDESATSTTVAALESAAGKPCVPFADTLPAGAPEVPITPGVPSAELVSEDLVEGTGDPVPAGATVTVDYIGVSCSTGMIFDDSYSRGQPATFGLDQVISGWTTGIPGMKVGGQRLLIIPPDQAYGTTGNSGIAPDETLYFVVTLESFEPPATATPETTPETTVG